MSHPGPFCKQVRIARGLSEEDVAQKVDCDPAAVTQFELGDKRLYEYHLCKFLPGYELTMTEALSARTIDEICAALDSSDEILTGLIAEVCEMAKSTREAQKLIKVLERPTEEVESILSFIVKQQQAG